MGFVLKIGVTTKIRNCPQAAGLSGPHIVESDTIMSLPLRIPPTERISLFLKDLSIVLKS